MKYLTFVLLFVGLSFAQKATEEEPVVLAPAAINSTISNAKIIKLQETRFTIPSKKEYDGKDSVVVPAKTVAPIPTRDMWLDSLVKAGDIITVVIQQERDGKLIGNKAFRAEPAAAEVDGKIRVKIMNVR